MSVFIWFTKFSLKTKEVVRLFFHNWFYKPYLRNYTLVIFFFSGLNWFLAWSTYRQSQGQQLILHYNIKFGADRIGDPSDLFFLPLIGLAVFFVNLILANAFKSDKNFLGHLLLYASLIFNQLILASLWSIYLINFR